MGIAANMPKRPLESADELCRVVVALARHLPCAGVVQEPRAGVVMDVIAVATPALSMSASDFSGVQSRTGPGMFFAMSAATYGGGV